MGPKRYAQDLRSQGGWFEGQGCKRARPGGVGDQEVDDIASDDDEEEAQGGVLGPIKGEEDLAPIDEDDPEEKEGPEEDEERERLRAMLRRAAQEHPDFEHQRLLAEEAEAEAMARFLPRTVLVVVAAGFSEVDVCVPVRVLRGALIGVEVAAVSSSALVQGGSGMCLQADTALEVLKNVHDFVAVVVPGGNASYCDIVGRDVRLRTILQEFDRRSKLVCGLGTGVLALRNARVLHGRKVAASPEVRSQLAAENLGPVRGAATSFADSMLQPLLGSAGWAGDDVVALRADGHVLTAQGEGTSLDFALSVIEILRNRTAAHAAALLARHPRLETVFTQGHEVVNDCAAAPETLAEQGLLVGVPLGPCGDLTVLPAEPGALPPQEEGGVGVGRDERERKAAVFGPSGARPDVGTQEAVGVVPGMVSAGVTAGKENGNVSSGHAGREVLDVNIDRIETESAIEYLCKMRAEEQQARRERGVHVHNYEEFMAEYEELETRRFNGHDSVDPDVYASLPDLPSAVESATEGDGKDRIKQNARQVEDEQHSCDHTEWECRVCGKTPFVWRE